MFESYHAGFGLSGEHKVPIRMQENAYIFTVSLCSRDFFAFKGKRNNLICYAHSVKIGTVYGYLN